MANDVVWGIELSNRSLREDHQPSHKEVAMNLPSFSALGCTERATSCNSHFPHWWGNSRQLKPDLYSHLNTPQMSRSEKQALFPTPAANSRL
ncbi:hypothetical protein DPMN_029895 [Dreissena polymorpha]|uniref:Uncharacterized protein n=1 Tax=Dreissena polymorpha TaxID=45954 RepID=A0A9D4M1P6_DREPO|nr:hypothetical protein DPMN_029895 [Dreissena polymorpha]